MQLHCRSHWAFTALPQTHWLAQDSENGKKRGKEREEKAEVGKGT